MHDLWTSVSEATQYIRENITVKPEIAIILGSGLGEIADAVVSERVEIPYAQIPNFPVSTVQGHSGRIIAGKIYDKNVIIMQGRFHYYEGYDLTEVTFPIRVFALLGVSQLIISNAAGGINKKLQPTDLMLITDHINMSNLSPLRGIDEEAFGERFPSMTNAYSPRLLAIAKSAAQGKMDKEDGIDLKGKILLSDNQDTKIDVKEGVYAFMSGPQYETSAEIRMLNTLGADAVGMSTVPEVIVAKQMGIEVLGISCITNMTGGVSVPSHEEVIENADLASEKFRQLIMRIIRKL